MKKNAKRVQCGFSAFCILLMVAACGKNKESNSNSKGPVSPKVASQPTSPSKKAVPLTFADYSLLMKRPMKAWHFYVVQDGKIIITGKIVPAKSGLNDQVRSELDVIERKVIGISSDRYFVYDAVDVARQKASELVNDLRGGQYCDSSTAHFSVCNPQICARGDEECMRRKVDGPLFRKMAKRYAKAWKSHFKLVDRTRRQLKKEFQVMLEKIFYRQRSRLKVSKPHCLIASGATANKGRQPKVIRYGTKLDTVKGSLKVKNVRPSIHRHDAQFSSISSIRSGKKGARQVKQTIMVRCYSNQQNGIGLNEFVTITGLKGFTLKVDGDSRSHDEKSLKRHLREILHSHNIQ